MRRSLLLQGLLHFPALSFLLLAALVFFLPQDPLIPPITAETVANDIVWTRTTALGETINLSAGHLQRQADGIVNVKDVSIKLKQHDVYLRGEHGKTDLTYEKIWLTNASGELITPAGERITLSLASALYHIDGTQLSGEAVNIHQHNNKLTGDTFHWDGNSMRLRGNVNASYYAQQKGK